MNFSIALYFSSVAIVKFVLNIPYIWIVPMYVSWNLSIHRLWQYVLREDIYTCRIIWLLWGPHYYQTWGTSYSFL